MNPSKAIAAKKRSGALLCGGCALVLAACGAREAGAPKSPPAHEPAPATYNLYVGPNGSDTNPGTAQAPFKTIARAAKDALPGTTVHVAPGSYAGGFKTTANGTATDRIAFVSTTRWGAKLVPPENSTSRTAWDNRGSYVDIVGFEVDGAAHRGGARWTTGLYSGGSYDSIRNNHVHHIASDTQCAGAGGGAGIGVDSYYRGVHSDVIGNTVHDIGPTGCRSLQGIYVNTPSTVKNNIVYRVAEAGIQLWHDAHNVIIANNTIANSNIGIVVGGGDYYFTKGPNDNTHVHDNIVYDNKTGISEQGATGKNNTYRNNLVSQNATANWSLRNGLTHSGTIDAAPQFVAYTRSGTPDLRLSPSSPAIGKGGGKYAHPVDLGGGPRTASTGYDIGAYQH
jgi:hypothetical protein